MYEICITLHWVALDWDGIKALERRMDILVSGILDWLRMLSFTICLRIHERRICMLCYELGGKFLIPFFYSYI